MRIVFVVTPWASAISPTNSPRASSPATRASVGVNAKRAERIWVSMGLLRRIGAMISEATASQKTCLFLFATGRMVTTSGNLPPLPGTAITRWCICEGAETICDSASTNCACGRASISSTLLSAVSRKAGVAIRRQEKCELDEITELSGLRIAAASPTLENSYSEIDVTA